MFLKLAEGAGGEVGIDVEGGGDFGEGEEAVLGFSEMEDFLGWGFAGGAEEERGKGEEAGAPEGTDEEVGEAVVLYGLVLRVGGWDGFVVAFGLVHGNRDFE